MFLFSSWPNPCVLTTQGAGWRSRTHPQPTNQTILVPKPEFSPRSCSGHWGSATSLQRLCLTQKAPAKTIPTPDKLFSIHLGWRNPANCHGDFLQSPRDEEMSAAGIYHHLQGPSHTIPVSSSQRSQQAGNLDLGEWGMQGVVEPEPNKPSKALSCHSFPPGEEHWETGASPWGSHPNSCS